MVIHPMSCESKNNGYINPVKMHWWPFWNISNFTQARFCSAMESSRLVHKTPIFQWEIHLCCFLSQSINQPTCLIFQVVQALLFQSHQPKTICKKKKNWWRRHLGMEDVKMSRLVYPSRRSDLPSSVFCEYFPVSICSDRTRDVAFISDIKTGCWRYIPVADDFADVVKPH